MPPSLHPGPRQMAEVPGHSRARTPHLPWALFSSCASQCDRYYWASVGELSAPSSEDIDGEVVRIAAWGSCGSDQSGGRCVPNGELHVGNIASRVTKQKWKVSLCNPAFPSPPCTLRGSSSQHHSERWDHSQFPFVRLDPVPCQVN